MQIMCAAVAFYPRDVYVSALLAMATWLAGWLSVTLWYCIKTAKPILKLFRPSGSPIILVSSDPAPIPNSRGTPSPGGYKYTGWEKLATFDENHFYPRNRAR